MSDPNRDRIIEQTISAAAKRNGVTAAPGALPAQELDPRAALMQREQDELRAELGGIDRETVAAIRREDFHQLLEFFFAAGPAPDAVLARVYSVAKAFRGDLIYHMSVRDLGKISNESHGTWSWRLKHVVNEYVKERTGDDVRLPWQKSQEACAKYASAQKGNRNRRTSGQTKRE